MSYNDMMAELKALKENMPSKSVESSEPAKTVEDAKAVPAELEEKALEPQEEVAIEASDSPSEDIENEAMALGWVPKEKYRGNPDDYVDAQTFIDRGFVFRPVQIRKLESKLEQEAEENKKLREMVKGLVTDIRTVEEKTRQSYIAELEEQRQRAIESDSYSLTSEIDKKLAEYKATPAGQAPKEQPKSEAIINYERENLWVKEVASNPIAKAAWDDTYKAVNTMVAANPNASEAEQLKFATDYAKRRYPELKFASGVPALEENEKSKVVTGNISSRTPSKVAKVSVSVKDLTPNQLSNYQQFCKDPHLGMSGEEYLKLIAKTQSK